MNKKIILVTGSNGFLGREICRQLSGVCEVIGLTRTMSSKNSLVSESFHSTSDLARSYGKVDAVLHLAAHIPRPLSESSCELELTNVRLVEDLGHIYPAARHVLASSVAVYGQPRADPISITTPPNQPTAYGLSKLKAESILHCFENWAVIRFSSIIGVGMTTNSFIPQIIRDAKTGSIKLLGNGSRLQNYVDVRDAASMCITAILRTDSYMSLGIGERSYSNEEVATMISLLTGASINYEGVDHSPSFVYRNDDAAPINRSRIALPQTLNEMLQCDI